MYMYIYMYIYIYTYIDNLYIYIYYIYYDIYIYIYIFILLFGILFHIQQDRVITGIHDLVLWRLQNELFPKLFSIHFRAFSIINRNIHIFVCEKLEYVQEMGRFYFNFRYRLGYIVFITPLFEGH